MNKLLTIVLCIVTALLLLSPTTNAFDPTDEVCKIGNGASTSPACAPTPAEDPVAKTIGQITLFIAGIIGSIAVIMIMIGGFRYITSGGDSNAVAQAKKTIIWAAVGLVVTVLAAAIIQFVVNKLIL